MTTPPGHRKAPRRLKNSAERTLLTFTRSFVTCVGQQQLDNPQLIVSRATQFQEIENRSAFDHVKRTRHVNAHAMILSFLPLDN